MAFVETATATATLLVAIDRLYGRIEKHLRDASIDRSVLKAMQNDVRELRTWASAETTDRVIGEIEVYCRLETIADQLHNFEQRVKQQYEDSKEIEVHRESAWKLTLALRHLSYTQRDIALAVAIFLLVLWNLYLTFLH
jgi:hypothetical protein